MDPGAELLGSADYHDYTVVQQQYESRARELYAKYFMIFALLILNTFSIPEKVFIKYEGIAQEFIVDWNKWGWAPVSLLKKFDKFLQVTLKVKVDGSNTHLKIAKVYLRYQDIGFTDQ